MIRALAYKRIIPASFVPKDMRLFIFEKKRTSERTSASFQFPCNHTDFRHCTNDRSGIFKLQFKLQSVIPAFEQVLFMRQRFP